MRIAIAQLNYHTGNFSHNTGKIIETIEKARKLGCSLVIFAELCITGYPPRDFLEFEDFLNLSDASLRQIALKCEGITAIVGAPSRNLSGKGKSLHNSAYVLRDGEVKAVVHKSLLPTYDVFDEYRYFEPAQSSNVIEVGEIRAALTICEDLWNEDDTALYQNCPMEWLAPQKPDIIINIAASPFARGHIATRKKVLLRNVERYGIPLLYANHVGAQTELIFDGGSMAINAGGEIVDEMAYFDEEFKLYDFENGRLMQVGADHTFLPENETELVYDALISGVRDYFAKLGFKKAILGSSGGIDSAVVQAIASAALGGENVTAMIMPSVFSSDHSVNDAVQLSQNLGNPFEIVSIQPVVDSLGETLEPLFEGKEPDLTEENIQARVRAVLLMAMSNKFGPILLNTSNKSEAAVGYGTLYGDMCGGLSVLGDVYKTEVYQLARFINREKEIIPEHILIKPPSAELRPDQKDSDSLPEYEILDPILRLYIEGRKGPQEIIDMGYDETLVRRILRLVNINEYKRHQTPPVLRVSTKAFGMGRRMPIVAKYLN